MQQRYFHIQFAQERRKYLSKVHQPDQVDHMIIGEEETKDKQQQQREKQREEKAIASQHETPFEAESHHLSIDIEV